MVSLKEVKAHSFLICYAASLNSYSTMLTMPQSEVHERKWRVWKIENSKLHAKIPDNLGYKSVAERDCLG
jgi:hypothetical protein